MRTSEEIRFQILAIQREGNRIFAKQLSSAGLTPSQAEAIALLDCFGNLSLKELGSMLVCETGDSPSRLIARLVAAGFVGRSKDLSDGRAVSLSLTETGRNVFDSVIKPSEEALHLVLEESFGPQQLEQVRKLLSDLSARLGADKALRARLAAREK